MRFNYLAEIINKKNHLRFFLYLSGLYLTALGIVVTTQSTLGVAAVTCLATTISMLFHVSLGTVLSILYCGFVGIEFIILRKDFNIKNFLQMFFAFVFGLFTDSITWFLHISPSTFLGKFILLWIGLAFCALGVVITIQMDIVPCAPDGLVNIIAAKKGQSFGKTKVCFDSICVITSLFLSLCFLHNLGGFGITTLISALFLGRIMNVFEYILNERLHKFVFGGNENE